MSAISRKARATAPLTPARARLLRSTSIAAAAAFLALATGAKAQDLTWDTGNGPGFQGGNGNWNVTDTNWSLSTGAGDSDLAFVNGRNVTFGPDNNADVTIDAGAVSPASIIFSGNGYVILGAAANSLDVTGTMTIRVVDAGDTAQISAPLTMASGETVTFTANSNGTLRITGGINPGGAVGGTFVAAGETLTIDDDAAINANVSNTGSTTSSGGDIGGNLAVSGGNFTHNTAGSVTGTTTVSGGTLTAAGGDFGATGVTLTTGNLTYTGDSAGDVAANGGTLNVNGGGTLRGNLVNDGATTTNNGTITGTVDVLDGTLTNAGTANIDGLTTIDGGTVNANGGDFNGGITLTTGDLNYNGNSTGNVTANGGTVDINNGGTLAGTLDVLGAATVTNTGSGNVTGLTTINAAGAVVNANGGDFNGGITLADGDLNYNGNSTGAVTATGGTIDINNGGTLDGNLNSGGTTDTDILAGGQVNGNVTVSGGTLDNAGTLGNAAGDTVSVTGGTLTNTNDIAGTVGVTGTGTLTNSGAAADIAGLVTVNSATAIVNAAGGDFNGGITLTLGDLNYTGDSDGNVAATGGTVDIAATGILRGTLSNTGTAITTIAVGGQVTGNTTVGGGTLGNDGTIGGTVLVNGTGTLNNNGAGAITGLTTVNSATAIVNAAGGDFNGGLTLTLGDVNYTGDSAGNVTANGGTLDIAATGILRGTLNNGGATTVIVAGGQVTGATTVSGGSVSNDGTIDDNVSVSGTGTLNNTGSVTGTVGISGTGIVNNDATGDIAGVVTVNGGTLNANGGTFSAAGNGIVTNGGTVNILAATDVDISHTNGTTNITAALTGNVSQTGAGTVTNDGGITGNVTRSNGTFNNNNSISGTVITSGGTFSNGPLGSVVGLTTVNGGTVNANGGTFNGITTTSGTVNVNAATTTNITNGGATVSIDPTITLTGNINQSSGVTNNDGIVAGNVTVSGGTFENDGTAIAPASVTGTVTISGGSFDNETDASVGGQVAVSGTGTLNMNGGTFTTPTVTNNGGTINVNVTTVANVTNTSGTLAIDAGVTLTGTVTSDGTVDLDGTLGGNLTNTGIVNAAGGSAVTGTVNNNATGALNVTGGTVTFDGQIINATGATLDVAAGATLTSNFVGDQIENSGIFNIAGSTNAITDNSGTINATGASFTGAVRNLAGGIINASGATSFTPLVTNAGTINGSGNLTFGGGLNSTGTLSTVNGAATDVITLGADSNLNGTILRFDIDLDPAVGTVGASDTLVITGGSATGNVTLAFNSLGAGAVDLDDLLIIDAAGGANNLNVGTPTFAPPLTGGSFVYFLVQPGGAGTDLFLRNQVNPGITALAGNVTLTQSLIGSIINRPSSPFVSGLAYDDPDSCGPGLWARAIAGTADATGNSTADAGLASERTTGSSLSATYGGVQLGGDFACFNGYLNGWDVAVGGIGGVNLGSVDQPVTVPGVGLNDPAITTSITQADFLQYYGGVYATASRGPLALDLQYRLEKTDFTVNNTAVGGGAALGITDSDFSSSAQTLSGSASYGFPVGDTNFAIVPTAGFAWTRTSTDPIVFDNGDTLLIDDFDSQTLFVGATVARTIFSESGESLQRQFVTASYYNDFADDPTAVFDTGGPVTGNLINENLGAYTELSAGWNYVRILNPGQIGPARQLDASIRADARVGDQLNSYGITGQLRLQF